MSELKRPTIQLADASGPQPLSDKSNYKFLQQIFDAKEKEPLAKIGYDVNSVFQILEGKKGYKASGAYSPDIAEQPDTNLNKEERDFLYTSNYENLDRLAPKMSEANKGVIMMQPWNTDKGVKTLIHEFRHKAINENPVLKKIVDDSRFSEELIVRAMDVKYFDKKEAKKYVNKYKLTKYGQELLMKTIDLIEENAEITNKELTNRDEFNQGGIANFRPYGY